MKQNSSNNRLIQQLHMAEKHSGQIVPYDCRVNVTPDELSQVTSRSWLRYLGAVKLENYIIKLYNGAPFIKEEADQVLNEWRAAK